MKIVHQLTLPRMIIFNFLTFFTLLACINESPNTEIKNQETKLSIDSTPIIKEYELATIQQIAWDSIKQEWISNHYNKCLKQQKLKISCKDCPAAFIHVQLDIDAEGRLSTYKILKKRDCNKLGLEECIMDYFEQLRFPKTLRKISLEVRLGRVLKC